MLWLGRFSSPITMRPRLALALTLTFIAALACADRVANPLDRAPTDRASADINPSPIDDLWISPNRAVVSGTSTTGTLTLRTPLPSDTRVIVKLSHPTPYVSFDTILDMAAGTQSKSFPVYTSASPYQLGIYFYADVGTQRYTGNGFTLYPTQAPEPPAPVSRISVLPGSLTFGPQAPNTVSAPQNVTVSNTGTTNLWMGNIGISAPFKIQSNGCPNMTLYVGVSCIISVAYAPTTGSPLTGSLTVQSGAPSSPNVVTLNGTATPAIYVTPTVLGFGSVTLGNGTSGRVVKITNTGTGPLLVSSLALGGANPGDFWIYANGCTNVTLNPGASCTAYVSFEPMAIGTRTAKVTIAHNASGGPTAVSLSGTGVKAAGGYIP